MPKQGTIVLVPFPFTNLSAAKVRPALVLFSAKSAEADVILAFISSKQRKGEYAVAIAPSKTNGLKMPSVITCSKIATLERTVILGELGFAERDVMDEVRSKLAVMFGL